MTYLAHPVHYTPAEFRAYVSGLKFDKGWKPSFPTLHNTGVPSLAQWLAMGALPQERWGANLDAYYQGLGWHAGPHLVCCPSYVWVLSDPEAAGVSVSCWNRVTFGIEMVGNYEAGGDDFASGLGSKVRDNAVFVLATLCEKFGWDIGKTLHFHRECPADHHACPGTRVSKNDIVQRVKALLESWGSAQAPALPETPRKSSPPSPLLDLSTVAGVQRALNALGYRLAVDGELGPQTEAALRSFQLHVGGLAVDGHSGPATIAAIRRELAQS